MKRLGGSHITYSFDSGLLIPTFHCKCGEITEGFSVCLKCNPIKFTVLTGQVPNLPWETLQTMTDDEIEKFNRSHLVEVEMIATKEQAFKNIEGRIESIQNLSIECIELIYIAAYNEAIEAAANKCDRIFLTDNMRIVVSDEIRRLKK